MVNAERCTSLLTETQMSHSYATFSFPVLSPSSFTLFFFFSPSAPCSFDPTFLTVKGLTLIYHNGHSLYENPLGTPISIQNPLSIQGNKINHIISYKDDKVGRALLLPRRESCTGFLNFFYWIWPAMLTFMLVFMSGKLLFDIQIMTVRGGFSPKLH